MAIPTYAPRSAYIGNGTLASYTFDFKIADLTQIQILVSDENSDEVFRVDGNDTTFLSSVTFDPIRGGGIVTLPGNLTTDYQIVILLASDAPKQPFRFRDAGDFSMKTIEAAFDRMMVFIQRIAYMSQRSLRMNDNLADGEFNPQLPFTSTDVGVQDNRDRVFVVNDTNDGFKAGPTVASLDAAVVQTAVNAAEAAAASAAAALQASIAAEAAAAAALSGLPEGGLVGDYVEKTGIIDNEADWFSGTFSGFSSRYGANLNLIGLRAALLYVFNFTYTAAGITLSAAGSGTIREKGASVASTLLTAALVKRSNLIAAVRFYQGATLLDTQVAGGGIPNGGNSTFNYATPFTDNITFTAEVDDVAGGGGPTTASSSTSFVFVYPYYVGAGAVGLNAAAIAALTKRIIQSTSSRVESITAANTNVLYFAYPAAYGLLTSILDVNSFETIGDWTQSTKSITGLDGNAVNYYCYEFNNPVGAGAYQYTFKR